MEVVTRVEYTADQRTAERRWAELDRLVAEVRQVHAEDIREIRLSLDKLVGRFEVAQERRGSNLRQNIYSVLIPSLLFLGSVLVQIWMAKGGA